MHLLIVDDDDALRGLLGRELARSGHSVTLAATAAEAFQRVTEAEPDVVLLDLMLPDQPGVDVLRRLRAEHPDPEVVVLTAHGTIDTALAAMKLGAYDYLQKPCRLQEIELTIQRAFEKRRLSEENARLKDGLSQRWGDVELVGRGRAHDDLRRFIAKLAASDSTVLLRGETGTGKEMVARAIHRLSSRHDNPFVVVDSGSLQDSLLQSELFGHEQGAFTGAVKLKHGLFEVADAGTIFLDEIGDVSPAIQAGLLRVLETSSFRRLGGTREIRVDVRMIAATNRDLDRLMAERRFREDLFFRLNAIHLTIAPLRQRPHEIPCLVEHFVARHNARCDTRKRIAPDALEELVAGRWPGNVRELRNAVERVLVLAEADVVRAADLPSDLRGHAARAGRPRPVDAADVLRLADVERRHVARVLEQVGGHRARAARLLGISQRSLYRKLQELRLDGDDTAGPGGDRE